MESRAFDMAHAGSENRRTLRLPFHGTFSLTWARRDWRVFFALLTASVPRSTAIHTLLFDSGPRPVQYRRMEPIQSIVAAYVRLRNRKALDDLRAHWGRLTAELKSLPGPYDASKVIAQLDNEIAIIDAGLSLLDTAAAA